LSRAGPRAHADIRVSARTSSCDDPLMRIIAGSRKGHTIHAPRGRDTRPTSDRVRENVFNIVGPVDGATVLDLYAGSGAMVLAADGLVVVETDARIEPELPLTLRTSRKYGQARVTIYEAE